MSKRGKTKGNLQLRIGNKWNKKGDRALNASQGSISKDYEMSHTMTDFQPTSSFTHNILNKTYKGVLPKGNISSVEFIHEMERR